MSSTRLGRATLAALLCLCAIAGATGRAPGATAGLVHERSIYLDGARRRLEAPEGVACADDGRLVVADTGHGRLLTYTWQEGDLRGGEQLALPELPYPTRLQLDPAGNLLVLDRKLRRIGRVDAAGRFAGYLEVRAASPASSILPNAFKLDSSGNVYLLDAAGRRMLAVEPSGRVARDVALPKTGSFTDLALGSRGKVYAMDAVTATVWVVDAGGKAFRRLAPSLKSRIRFPTDMTSDGEGHLFVVDHNGDAIVVLGENGRFEGRALSTGQGNGQLWHAAQICVTRGTVYIADEGNSRVQVFARMR